MAVRSAEARWTSGLKDGRGTMKLGSGAYDGAYSFASRFEQGTGTNPEEWIGGPRRPRRTPRSRAHWPECTLNGTPG
jgi:hypothetical protein